jgi:hypothetical protein
MRKARHEKPTKHFEIRIAAGLMGQRSLFNQLFAFA